GQRIRVRAGPRQERQRDRAATSGEDHLMPDLPLYQVIVGDIRAGIRLGEFSPGAQLPSETDLGRRYQVSRMTVRQALNLLASEGLVTRKQGSGTYVNEARRGRRIKS